MLGCAIACGRMWYQLVPFLVSSASLHVWYPVLYRFWYLIPGDANPIRYKAFVAAFCYGFRWYGRWIQARIYCQAGQMLANADRIAYKAFIGVFKAIMWLPGILFFARKVSDSVDMLCYNITQS